MVTFIFNAYNDSKMNNKKNKKKLESKYSSQVEDINEDANIEESVIVVVEEPIDPPAEITPETPPQEAHPSYGGKITLEQEQELIHDIKLINSLKMKRNNIPVRDRKKIERVQKEIDALELKYNEKRAELGLDSFESGGEVVKGFNFNIYRSNFIDSYALYKDKNEVLVTDSRLPKMWEVKDDEIPVVIKTKKMITSGKDYMYAEPKANGSWAFSGSFIWTSDSRGREVAQYPIPLHDRDMSKEKQFAKGGATVSVNQQTANEIAEHLGGKKNLADKVNAYDFYAIENGLFFKLRNPRANIVKIILNKNGLYNVEIGRLRGINYKIIYDASNLYADMLMPIVAKYAGVDLASEKPMSSSYEDGGQTEVADENKEMVLNQNEQIRHHTNELEEAAKESDHIPAWVVGKIERSATDISDATHFLEGGAGKYAKGGQTKKRAIIKFTDEEYGNLLSEKPQPHQGYPARNNRFYAKAKTYRGKPYFQIIDMKSEIPQANFFPDREELKVFEGSSLEDMVIGKPHTLKGYAEGGAIDDVAIVNSSHEEVMNLLNKAVKEDDLPMFKKIFHALYYAGRDAEIHKFIKSGEQGEDIKVIFESARETMQERDSDTEIDKDIITKGSHKEIMELLNKAVKDDNFELFKKIWAGLYNAERDKEIARIIMVGQPVEKGRTIEEVLFEQAKKSIQEYEKGGEISLSNMIVKDKMKQLGISDSAQFGVKYKKWLLSVSKANKSEYVGYQLPLKGDIVRVICSDKVIDVKILNYDAFPKETQVVEASLIMHEKGGLIGFEALEKKVAKEYVGKKVKPEYQKKYGKTYDAEEAKEVGKRVAAKVKGQIMKKKVTFDKYKK